MWLTSTYFSPRYLPLLSTTVTMAENLVDLLKLTRSQMNTYKKEEILDVLEAASASGVSGNNIDISGLNDSIKTLTNEIKGLQTSLSVYKTETDKQINEMKDQLSKQNDIIAKQQLYLEKIDRKERECNLVILGVPENNEAFCGATSDTDKLNKVWDTAGITCSIKSFKRIGNPERRRPMLVVVNSRDDRDAALEKAKSLKENEVFKKIFIKRDTHPSVRAEWTRLHEVVRLEKSRSENTDCDIRIDFKTRKVYKDRNVIDQWNMQGF